MNYHNITTGDMLNGEGLRVVLWVSGCHHSCKGCQNPQTHNDESGVEFDLSARVELEEELEKDYIQGITLSGGDPLYPKNRKEITELCKYIKQNFPKKDIWVYTGYLYEQVKDLEIMKYIDVLVDGPFIEILKDNTDNCPYRGSANQRIIDVQNSISEGNIIIYDSNNN